MHSDPAEEVSAAQTVELLEGEAVLLDVREQHEWDAGHAPQARHLPMSQLNERADELPTDVPIVCVCHGGGRSSRVSAVLRHSGWRALNLTGGMVAWHAAGLPVVDHAGNPGQVD
ncbi:MAG TPA: rhodanese-like domain-containing protein [Jatrophihabitans sp.]|nr:rhodanese-like domain-containing protein [Jatrophihabitans sp.]